MGNVEKVLYKVREFLSLDCFLSFRKRISVCTTKKKKKKKKRKEKKEEKRGEKREESRKEVPTHYIAYMGLYNLNSLSH